MKRFCTLFISLALLLGLCACATKQKEPTWQEQYDLGVRYLSEGNYEEAIIAFTAAIEIDPKQPDAYAELANVYLAMGDTEHALQVLTDGVAATGDILLQDKLDEFSHYELEPVRNVELISNTFWDQEQEMWLDYAVITAYSKTGEVIWAYETPKYQAAELDTVIEIGQKDDRYYYAQDGAVIALDVQTGNVIWENNDFGGSKTGAAFGANAIYLCGQYGPDFYAISYDGQTLSRIEQFDNDFYWASEIKLLDREAAVYMSEGSEDYNISKIFYVDLETYTVSTDIDDTSNCIWLDELRIESSDRYTGNMGDSFIDKIGSHNGSVDTEGNNYEHGLEAWIARWNNLAESSWAWCTYNLDAKFDTLTGTIGILSQSHNKNDFDTTLEILGDDTLLYSLKLFPNMSNVFINLNITGVKTLKISVYDNISAYGGTSFALGNFQLCKDDSNLPQDSSLPNDTSSENPIPNTPALYNPTPDVPFSDETNTSVIDLDNITDICMSTAGIPADTVIATVDGEEISAMEYLYWVAHDADNLYSYFYNYYGQTQLPWDETLGTTSPRQFVQEDALHGAALYHLVSRRANVKKLTVDQRDLETIQTSLDDLEVQQADRGGSQMYMWLSLMDEELYRWYCQCEYLYSYITDMYYGENSGNYPSDQTVLNYLEQEGWYSCKHIFLATVDTTTREPLDEGTIAAQKVQADNLLAQLRASNDPVTLFNQLMYEYSEDPGLDTTPNGYLAQPGQMYIEFEEGARALAVGEISDVVTTDVGYHIILRLPLNASPSDYRDDYIEDQMVEMRNGWVEAANIQTTEAFDNLDIAAFYAALQDVRRAYESRYPT